MTKSPGSPSTDLPPAKLNVVGVVPGDQMRGDDEEDTTLLLELLERAKSYLFSFDWCSGVKKAYFGDGVGGVVAVFLMQTLPSKPNVDEWLWVVEGDLPSACFVTDDLKNPHDVLKAYISHREKWIEHARNNETPPETVMPVDETPPTKEWADQLSSRLETLKKEFLPWFRRE